MYPLKNSAILDSGTTIHIFNQISRFQNFRTANPDDYVYAGNARVRILGYREVDIQVQSQSKTQILRLYDVVFCEAFAYNLVSLRHLRKRGFWWDNKPPWNVVRNKHDVPVYDLIEEHGQNVMEYIPYEISKATFYVQRHKFNSWTNHRANKADSLTWHLRLGHPGPEAMKHIVTSSKGVRLQGIPTNECDDCTCSKAKRIIHREPRTKEIVDQAGTHLAIDFHDFSYEDKIGHYTSMMLVTDRYSGFIWDFYFYHRTAEAITEALWWLFKILFRQYQIVPQVIECDNEVTNSDKIMEFLT